MKKLYIIILVILLLVTVVGAVAISKANSTTVQIIETSKTGIDELAEDYPEDKIPVTSQEIVDFTVNSVGRGKLSTFEISVWTTHGEEISLGEFSFVLRQIEEIGPHDTYMENYIDYFIPEDWNSSQKLTETITVKEILKNPVRAMIADEPLFIRGVDYPNTVPFDEVEIQVDLVNFYTDVNETEYVAWVRLLESEVAWDIKQVKIVVLEEGEE